MKRWQEVILKKFRKDQSQSIVVIDKDNLMQDDYLISQLQQQEYDVLSFAREVTFRNEFEERYRSKWDEGIKTQIVVIVQSQTEMDYLPYDLVTKSQEIKLSLVDVFPRLHYQIVQDLDKAYYQRLFEAHRFLVDQGKDHQKSIKETASFILRSVFHLDSVAINSQEKLIGLLIEKHYAGMSIPLEMQERIISELAGKLKINLDLSQALRDSKYFFNWLQEQWFEYLVTILSEDKARIKLDFTVPEIRLTIDNLFAEGKIKRYSLTSQQENSVGNLTGDQAWVLVGIEINKPKEGVKDHSKFDLYNLRTRLNLLTSLEENVSLRKWLDIGYDFAQLVHSFNMLSREKFLEVQDEFLNARNKLNRLFRDFLEQSYSTISFFDDNRGPISLARINHYIHKVREEKERVALLVFDGMSIDQWILVKAYLNNKLNLSFVENKCYAIAPTITSVSRQAIFSGRLPSHYAESLYTTSKEKERWESFWVNKGISKKRISYLNVRLTDEFDSVQEVTDSKNEILGIVVNFIDDLMHSTKDIKVGKRFFYDTLNSYLGNSNLDRLLTLLLNAGYKIYFTSDHGNIDGIGKGIKSPKDLLESYAKRTVIFDRDDLAKSFAQENNHYYFRPNYSPENFYPVYPPDNQLYTKNGSHEIAHGGISLEEMVVPFIEVVKE